MVLWPTVLDVVASLLAAPVSTCPADVDALTLPAAYAEDERLRATSVVVVAKAQRRLWLFEEGQLGGCWPIGLGFDPAGDKQREGDGRTPQGWYRTSDKPWSTFDGAIAIHYPNAEDAARGVEEGTISRSAARRIRRAVRRGSLPPQRTDMGGEVLIHGGGSSRDWTLGCVALDDEHLDALRKRMPAGQRSHLLIVP